jgi:hypothetical protein
MIARVRSALRNDPQRRADAIGIAVLALLVNLTFWPFLWGDATIQDSVVIQSLYRSGSRPVDPPVFAVNREVDEAAGAWQTEPWFALEHAQIFGEKTLPLWNPDSAFGKPLLANMQSQPLSPFAWVAIAGDDARSYNRFVALRIFVAGVLAFLFMRRFVSLGPSLVGGASFMYLGYLWLYVTMPEVSVEVVIPGLLLAIELLLRKPTGSRISFMAIMLALAVFGGMPESLLLAFAFAYAYGVWRLLGEREFRSRALRIVAAGAAASALGFGLSAILLLPFLEYLPLAHSDHANPAIGSGHDSLMPAWPALYFAPLLHGPTANNIFTGFSGYSGIRGYFGAVVGFFAGIAAIGRVADATARRASRVPIAFFAIFAAIALAKRFGAPAVNWLGTFPYFSLIDYAKYGEATLGCAVALLAGFGVAAVIERRASALTMALAAAVPLTAMTVAACVEAVPLAQLTANQWYFPYALVCALGAMALAFGVSLAARLRLLSARVGVAAAFSLVVLEAHAGYIVPIFYWLNKEAPLSDSTLLGAPYVSFLQSHTRDASRVIGQDGLLYPEWSAAFGVADARGLDALYDLHYLKLAQALYGVGGDFQLADRFTGDFLDFGAPLWQRFLELGSVRYVLSRDPVRPGGALARALTTHPALIADRLRPGTFVIGNDVRAGIFIHAPATRVPVDFDVPTDARALRFGIGMVPIVWAGPICGDGVRYTLEIRTRGGTRKIFERYIDPKHNVAERRWNDQVVPIAAYRGRKVTLLLSTAAGPSGNTCADWAIWSEIRVATRNSNGEPPRAYRLLYKDPYATISEFPKALPRVAIYRHVVVADDDAEALSRVAAPEFEPDREAVVEAAGAPAASLAVLQRTPRQPVIAGSLEYYASRRARMRVDAPAPGLVVFNDTDFPGWTAAVDGRSVPILRANYLFRGVVVAAGRHVVDFVYEPRSGAIGSEATLASFVVVLALPFVRRRRRRGSGPQPSKGSSITNGDQAS